MKSFKYVVLAALAVSCGGQIESGDSLDSSSQALKGGIPADGVGDAKGQAHHRSGGGNLIDHGGPVMASDTTRAIYWGTNFPSDLESGMASLFQGLNGTSFIGIANQYMRGSTATSSYAGAWTDTSSSSPTSNPATSVIVNEACKVIGANGATPNSSTLYVVFADNFPGNVNYCAWHSHGTCNGVDIKVAYMPNVTGVAGCDPGNLYNCNNYSQGTRAFANVTSHEWMEAITDADLTAWYDGSGSEIGDKCAWQFSSCVNLKNGNWQLQKEWSNAASGCVQQ